MIESVVVLTLYGIAGEPDRFRVSTLDDSGEMVDVTLQYELLPCSLEDGRVGFAVVKRTEPWPVAEPRRPDDDEGAKIAVDSEIPELHCFDGPV